MFTLERVTQQDVEQEQVYVSMLYAHIDELRERTSGRLAQTLRQTGGTPQARTERDVMVGMYTQRLAQLDAAEMGLCFGRIDSDDGDPRYIGRLGIRDEDADYKPLLLEFIARLFPRLLPPGDLGLARQCVAALATSRPSAARSPGWTTRCSTWPPRARQARPAG